MNHFNLLIPCWARGPSLLICLGLMALMAAAGCRPLRISTPPELLSERAAQVESAPPAVASHPTTPINLDALKNTQWIQVATTRPYSPAAPRWKNETVDAVWSSPQVDRAALASLAEHVDAAIAANAAICLARLGDETGVARLVLSAGDPQLPLKLRLAAVDALGQLAEPSVADQLRNLTDEIAGVPGDDQPARTYLPELHAELLYALARHVDAADESRFEVVGAAPPVDVALAVLAGWSIGRPAEIPQSIADWRANVDPRVRAAAVQALAARGSLQALVAAQAALNDAELDVRLAGIRSLGRIGTPEARKLVLPLAAHPGELVRAAAAEALDELGDDETVSKASKDKSWRVRAAVAATLARHPAITHLPRARELVVDRSVEVQRAVVSAIAGWPAPLAGPVLFTALERSSYSTQKAAVEQLAARWPAAREHSIDLPQSRLAESLAGLKRRWTEQYGDPDQLDAVATAVRRADAPLSAAQQEQAARWLAQLPLLNGAPRGVDSDEALQGLIALGLPLVTWLEQRVLNEQQPLAEPIYREVLPRLAEEFAALADLDSNDVLTRRRAAERLSRLADDHPLRPLAVERLTQMLQHERDPLVWRSALRSVRTSDTPAASRLAYAAIAHHSDEVRRLAVEHLADHPAPEHLAVLLPALEDSHPNVVRSAIRAVSQPQLPTPVERLKRLLGVNDRRVRLEAAAALVRMNDESGIAALERLASEPDVDVRRGAVIAMGASRRSEFVPTLIALVDQGQGVGQGALASLQQIVGVDVAAEVNATATSSSERVAAWRRWWDRQQ